MGPQHTQLVLEIAARRCQTVAPCFHASTTNSQERLRELGELRAVRPVSSREASTAHFLMVVVVGLDWVAVPCIQF